MHSLEYVFDSETDPPRGRYPPTERHAVAAAGAAPTAEQTERMLVEHAEALDLGTAEGRKELTDVAIKLRAIGALQASLKFRRMDVTCCTEQLGPRHERTVQAKMNLAVLLDDLGERDEARALYTEVIAGRTEQLGSTHTDTLSAKYALAILLVQMDERTTAHELYEKVLAGFVHAYGADHPKTQEKRKWASYFA